MTYAPTGSRAVERPREPSIVSTAVSSALRSIGRAITLWANRRAVYRLATLEDRFLRDIGVTRSDVDWALSQPWRVDPSATLAGRVECRKNAAVWARRRF
jgi:uncharacterized protein YjiS (DUF1127 family)